MPAQVIVKRGQSIEGPPGPIVVATRNDALQGVLDATPADRRQGVVLMQTVSCHSVSCKVAVEGESRTREDSAREWLGCHPLR